jgi:4Fe-4S single cluster domain
VRLTLAGIERARAVPGASVVLFLTDRCPVECAHCSVGSLRDSPHPGDPRVLDAILRAVAGRPAITTVAITGGEPFAEPAALWRSVRSLSDAGKDVVVHTSGYWGAEPASERVERVLERCSCVVLSTDSYHAAAVSSERFRAAARTITGLGAGLVVQTLTGDGHAERAEELLRQALGPDWREIAEITTVRPLPYGRGARVVRRTPPRPSPGRCRLVGTPVIRYDGIATACCNERVIMGSGPDRLRRGFAPGDGDGTTRDRVDAALDGLRNDPVLWGLGVFGPAALAAAETTGGICDHCWRLLGEQTDAEGGPLAVGLRLLRDGSDR